jgi:putative heme iron utilization protein
MKVQKVVSLDENTMRISQRMNNFSKWVRVGLNNYDQNIDLTSAMMEESQQKARWAKVSRLLAEAMLAKYIEHDPKYEGTVDDLIFRAIKEVNKQKTLEEFE